jgi:hypothetical protein
LRHCKQNNLLLFSAPLFYIPAKSKAGILLEDLLPYQSMESQRSLSVGVRRSIRPVFFSERILDAIPGGLAWLGMGVVILGAYTIPAAIVGAAALLATYSALRFTLAAVAFLWGLRLTRRWEAVDWLAKYDRRAAGDSIPLNRVHHVVIIPNYKEPLDLLRRTLGQLAKQSGAASAMSVILAMEAREPEATAKSASLRAEYGALFKNFFVAYHPRGLSGGYHDGCRHDLAPTLF